MTNPEEQQGGEQQEQVLQNVPEDTKENSAQESWSVLEQKETKSNKTILVVVGIVIALALGGLGYMYYTGSAVNRAPVATVNGENITRGELNTYADNVATNAQMPSVSEEERKELESYSLNLMIGEKLLLQEAKTQNIVASSQEVDSQLAMIMAEFSSEEEFQQALAQSNITKQELRENLEKQNIFIQLAQISVSEEEIMLLYEDQMVEQEDTPPYEDVKPLLRQYIEQQKLAEILPVILEELREKAEIQIFI